MFQETTERLTKRQRRILKNKGLVPVEHEPRQQSFNLKPIEPLTDNQRKAFEAYFDRNKNLLLHGIAGTGKTFLSLYFALHDVLENVTPYKKVVIVRSVVPTRDMGFLPGNQKEKSKVYEAPYYSICTELFGRGDAYDILKNKNTVEFITTSFVRGITLNNTIVIVDETQNLTLHELDSIITRIGRNCKVIFSGDFRQSDLTKEQEKNGLKEFIRILDNMKSFDYVEFEADDIVRSSLVKEYIITKDKLKIHT
jgi:phosphate starvation-inducible PhoH-like protein/PhoH-like ATPase